MSDDYVCTLDETDLKKAKAELNEDPKERLSAVETLREWVKQQRHIRCSTETSFLLLILRSAKFSQLLARELLVKSVRKIQENQKWYDLEGMPEEKLKTLYREGFIFVVPGYDSQSRRVVFMHLGKIDPTWTRYSFDDVILCCVTIFSHLLKDEKVQVNGIVIVNDLTGYSFKHQTAFTSSIIKRAAGFFQGRSLVRFKEIHYYNTGAFFETCFNLFKKVMSKKLQGRIRVHDSMEKVYKHIQMDMLPSDYLPDDYRGQTVGTIDEIIEKTVTEMMKTEVQAHLKKFMTTQHGIDESEKMSEDVPQMSFRKLHID